MAPCQPFLFEPFERLQCTTMTWHALERILHTHTHGVGSITHIFMVFLFRRALFDNDESSVWKFTFLHVWAAQHFDVHLFKNICSTFCQSEKLQIFMQMAPSSGRTTYVLCQNKAYFPPLEQIVAKLENSPSGRFLNFGQWQMKFVIFPLMGRTCGLGSPIKTCLQPMFIKWIHNQYE